MSDINLIEIGSFIGVHGIKGQVKLKSFTETPENIFNYKEFFLENNDKVLIIKLISKVKQSLICKIKDVDTRDEAENYRGLKLFIKQDSLPKLEDNEFYHRDLMEFEVYNLKKESFGKIKSFNDFGGGLLIEVKKENKLFYLPVGDNFLEDIDYKQKEVIINLDLSFIEN
ncbi:ribosome maturation factor RimM [Alphaproteobacteria bacterium]|nr:ribosome maturation factor RimM [Alphaproteobacteria bacterium]